MQRVVAAHDALQLGELADHVGHQVGLGQLRGLVGLRAPARRSPSCCADRLGDRAHALDALALRAQLVVIDHLAQAGDARRQRLLAVLVEEELGVGQARAHHALVAADHGAGVVRADVADDQELVGQLAGGVEQREVLLVGLHREDQAFLRHVEELRLELADQHVGALDQRGHFVEQRVVLDRLRRRRRPSPRPRPAGARSRRGASSKLAMTAPSCRQRGGVAVGVAKRHLGSARLEAVAVRAAAGLQAQRLDRHHVAAVQRHQRHARAHELHVAPAVGQLVGHDLGNRQLGDGFVQRLLQALGQRRALGGAVVEQRLGLAVQARA